MHHSRALQQFRHIHNCDSTILLADMEYEKTAETFYDSEMRIWSGVKKKDVFGPDMTLGEAALYLLSRNPDKIVQVMDRTGEELTAAQLIRDSKLMAVALQEAGLQIGDIVGINATNTTKLTAAMIGAFLCGTPTHAVFPGFDKETIKQIYKVSEPKVIFCDVETYWTTKNALDELQLVAQFFTLNGHVDGVRSVDELLVLRSDINLDNLTFACAKMSGDETAVVLCSSGTTGTPKGVLCSHRALLSRPLYTRLPKHATLFAFSTMYWASGLMIFVTALLNVAKRVITDKPFTPEYFMEIVGNRRITHLISGPHHLALLLRMPHNDIKNNFSHIQCILSGGSKVPRIICDQLNALLPHSAEHHGIFVGYGMSEQMIVSRNDICTRREGTEGKLQPNTDVRIVDKDGRPLGPNEEGIIHVRVPCKWSGYYRNPEVTQAAYIDGWIITGDIGYFDDDGFLHICARYTDVFKSNNFQIYPQTIEEVIMQVSGVQEVCVFGVPDFVSGNLIACAVVRTNTVDGHNLTSEDIINYVKKKMPEVYHLSGGIYFLNDLPKTGSGKIQRRKLLEILKPSTQIYER